MGAKENLVADFLEDIANGEIIGSEPEDTIREDLKDSAKDLREGKTSLEEVMSVEEVSEED